MMRRSGGEGKSDYRICSAARTDMRRRPGVSRAVSMRERFGQQLASVGQ